MCALWSICREFLVRSQATNRNAFSLAQWLSQHPAVDRIYYPGLTNAGTGESADNDAALAVFGAVARTKELTFAVGDSPEVHIPGRGCLLSLVLKSHLNTQVTYIFIVCKCFWLWRALTIYTTPSGVLQCTGGVKRPQLGHCVHSGVSVHAARALHRAGVGCAVRCAR